MGFLFGKYDIHDFCFVSRKKAIITCFYHIGGQWAFIASSICIAVILFRLLYLHNRPYPFSSPGFKSKNQTKQLLQIFRFNNLGIQCTVQRSKGKRLGEFIQIQGRSRAYRNIPQCINESSPRQILDSNH